MPRIEELKEPGYYFLIPEREKFNNPVVEVKPNKNKEVLSDTDVPHPMVFKEEQQFSYELPQAKLLPPSLTDLNTDIKQVAQMTLEGADSKDIAMVKQMTLEGADSKDIVMVKQMTLEGADSKDIAMVKQMTLEGAGSKDIAMVKPMTKEGADSKDIAMVKPMTKEGADSKDIAMVKPMTKEGADSKDIVMVKPMTKEGAGSKDIAMVKPMTLEGAGSKDIAMVKPMTKEGAGSKDIAMVKPMTKEELTSSRTSGITWTKEGIVTSAPAEVQGSDLMDSLKEHWKDTIKRMTTGFVENIKDWMKQKKESLKQEFHNFVSTTMRDYENAIMDPAQTLVKNAISNPLGTISDFPRNLKAAFGEVGQGLLNTTVDAGVTAGNKAIDTLNAGIKMGNTGVEALNKVNAFFGGKGKTIPAMKTIPRIPSREELLNQAVMKGGSLAKMNVGGNFDVQSFVDTAQMGKINRDELISMGSTPEGTLLPDDYTQWNGTPLWFTLQEDNVSVDENNLPIILDNTGRETVDYNKEWRKVGEKSYNYMGNREAAANDGFNNVMKGIYRGAFGFQAQPDIMNDITMTPYKYKVTAKGITGTYYPPEYPRSELGDLMIADFQVIHMTMNTEETWNLGVYGSIPLVVNYILPSSLSIRFVSDANLKTVKWLTAYQEYMTGYKLNPHVMRPYKMCCQEITCYALSFYGEVIQAKTFLAYPIFKDDFSMLGSGGVKHYETDWIVVGIKEFKAKPKENLKSKEAESTDETLEEQEPVTTEGDTGTDTENTDIADTTASSAVLESNSTDVDGANSDVDSVDQHTESFLEKVKSSPTVLNKLKDLANSDAAKSLAEKLGVGDIYNKALSGLDKLSDLDKLVRTDCYYLVCAYSNHIAAPSYGDTGLSYDSTDTSATFENKLILHARYKKCDDLSIKRAATYVQSLLDKGVLAENIKVIIASCDGIPGMNHFITGTAMTGGFYLGGIYQYTKAECQMESGDGNSEGLSKNRRVDLIYLDDFISDCPDAINEMMGTGSSDARGNNSKIKLLWNKIPKVSYGRDSYWGASLSLKKFTIYTKEINLGISGFSNVASQDTALSTDKETNEEKYDKISESSEENNLLIESGLGDADTLDAAAENYKKGEEVKQTTEESEIDYKIRNIATYEKFTESMQDSTWFNSHFPKKYRKDLIAKNTTVWDSYDGANVDQYISSRAVLPKGTDKTTAFPILVIRGSFLTQSGIANSCTNRNVQTKQNVSSLGAENFLLLCTYFRNNSYGWLYTAGDGKLGFWEKLTGVADGNYTSVTINGSSGSGSSGSGSSSSGSSSSGSSGSGSSGSGSSGSGSSGSDSSTPTTSTTNYEFGKNYKLLVASNLTSLANEIQIFYVNKNTFNKTNHGVFPDEIYNTFVCLNPSTNEKLDVNKINAFTDVSIKIQGIYNQGNDINAYLNSLYQVPYYKKGGMYYILPVANYSMPSSGDYATPPDYIITLINYIFTNKNANMVAIVNKGNSQFQFWQKEDIKT